MRINLRWVLATERRRIVLVVLLWAGAIASVFAQALYQRSYLNTFDYSVIVAVCFLAGVLIGDISKALFGYLAAMALGVLILFELLTLPLSLGALRPPGDAIVSTLLVTVLFFSIFPFPFLGFLIATLIGSNFGERYL